MSHQEFQKRCEILMEFVDYMGNVKTLIIPDYVHRNIETKIPIWESYYKDNKKVKEICEIWKILRQTKYVGHKKNNHRQTGSSQILQGVESYDIINIFTDHIIHEAIGYNSGPKNDNFLYDAEVLIPMNIEDTLWILKNIIIKNNIGKNDEPETLEEIETIWDKN